MSVERGALGKLVHERHRAPSVVGAMILAHEVDAVPVVQE